MSYRIEELIESSRSHTQALAAAQPPAAAVADAEAAHTRAAVAASSSADLLTI